MTVIKFEDVSKKYKLYSKGGLYLRDRITHALGRLLSTNGVAEHSAKSVAQSADSLAVSSLPHAQSPSPLALGTQHVLERDFWALKNMSFEIKKGESVGFIGRNGAGKSTILKLLAGVTKPSSGKVMVEGRVAAMIEVGAGFHPELTGRENVYLNGTIMGMKKAEIDRRFDSIVDFAELADFIDTPVKHYSSGMYVRLGFAIAAHTDPDIYLIDEVLAVGDESFQKKCRDTLRAHIDAKKTMILVSHDLDSIVEVCDRCIYVNHGEVGFDGLSEVAVKKYRGDVFQQSRDRQESKDSMIGPRTDSGFAGERSWAASDTTASNGRFRVVKARVISKEHTVADVEIDEAFLIEFDFESLQDDLNASSSIHVFDKNGICAFVAGTAGRTVKRGMHRHAYVFPAKLMNNGRYQVAFILLTDTYKMELHLKNAISFNVRECDRNSEYQGVVIGCVRPHLEVIETDLSQSENPV